MTEAEAKYKMALTEIKKKSPDIDLVLTLLNESINKGSSEAAYALATWYLFGNHVEQDWEKAVFLLTKASNKKYPSALYDLAVCFEEGKGVKKNKKEAFKLYVQAALRGDVQSVHEVGRCYYYGIGTKKDRFLADLWLERAEELDTEVYKGVGPS